MRSLKVLIVDDDRDNANSMGELFELEGHQAQVVYSGAHAVHRYLSDDFDMCFMDVMMPGMNGIASFMEIRKMKPHAKVFMMSGFSLDELLKQAVVRGGVTLMRQVQPLESLLKSYKHFATNELVVLPHIEQGMIEGLRAQALAEGIRLRVAASPAALECAGTDDDVLLLNMNLPIIDVIGIYAALQKTRDLPPTVLVMPFSNHAKSEEALLDMNVTGILSKPFDLDSVLSHVKQLAA